MRGRERGLRVVVKGEAWAFNALFTNLILELRFCFFGYFSKNNFTPCAENILTETLCKTPSKMYMSNMMVIVLYCIVLYYEALY